VALHSTHVVRHFVKGAARGNATQRVRTGHECAMLPVSATGKRHITVSMHCSNRLPSLKPADPNDAAQLQFRTRHASQEETAVVRSRRPATTIRNLSTVTHKASCEISSSSECRLTLNASLVTATFPSLAVCHRSQGTSGLCAPLLAAFAACGSGLTHHCRPQACQGLQSFPGETVSSAWNGLLMGLT
jgi:hypothetical protein